MKTTLNVIFPVQFAAGELSPKLIGTMDLMKIIQGPPEQMSSFDVSLNKAVNVTCDMHSQIYAYEIAEAFFDALTFTKNGEVVPCTFSEVGNQLVVKLVLDLPLTEADEFDIHFRNAPDSATPWFEGAKFAYKLGDTVITDQGADEHANKKPIVASAMLGLVAGMAINA